MSTGELAKCHNLQLNLKSQSDFKQTVERLLQH
jgi:hypothetical protein